MYYREEHINKLWSKVNKKSENDCWEWFGYKTKAGYGAIVINYKATYCHRLSYTIHKGEIPTGLHILHSCDNPACVNPNHLSAGTHLDNIQDRVNKGRSGARNKGKTHCKNGHEFTFENTRICPKGKRNCRTCINEYMRLRRSSKFCSV